MAKAAEQLHEEILELISEHQDTKDKLRWAESERDALAESHAALDAALEAFAIKHNKSAWEGHFPSCAAISHKRVAPPCSPRCAAAQDALREAHALVAH